MNRFVAELPSRLAYVALATALILSQHFAAWVAISLHGPASPLGLEFWLTPLRNALGLSRLSALSAMGLFAYSLAVAWALALLSFRRARAANAGYGLAVLSVVPVLQLGAIPVLSLLPARVPSAEESGLEAERRVSRAPDVVHGLIAGIAIVVLAVLVSAVTFGAYGWGLFVMTPFTVGLTTGYLVNRRVDQGGPETVGLVLGAAGLGSLALVVLALEGAVCIAMAAPLAIPVALVGGALGRGIAKIARNRRNPLASVAVLPMIFMLEGAMPPEVPIATARQIEIAATPEAVWTALTSPEAIRVPPGLTAMAGLAYPISGRLAGEGAGTTRTGTFSTGVAREKVTEWAPGRTLAFKVLRQPAAMEEMSPYRRVHAPHLEGYFDTHETRFELVPLADGRTRLTVRAQHRLRIDPVLYWEPIARLAIRDNVDRVLKDIAAKAERR